MTPEEKALEARFDRVEKIFEEIKSEINALSANISNGNGCDYPLEELSSLITITKKSSVCCDINSGNSDYFQPERIKISVTDGNGDKSFCHIGRISVGGAPMNLMDNVSARSDRSTAYGSGKDDRIRPELLSHSDEWRLYRNACFITVFGHYNRLLSIDFENPNNFDIRVYISILGNAVHSLDHLDHCSGYKSPIYQMSKLKDPYR